MDLDRFKAVVDTYGHLNGSRTIKEVAETIREILEKPAYAVAYAGDEFVVVLLSFDPSQAIEQFIEYPIERWEPYMPATGVPLWGRQLPNMVVSKPLTAFFVERVKRHAIYCF